ncbi:hypothetical protein ACNF42_08115 [Cuniculiplasma sp. SKW3]|uniref:hypothetical protein n=1 Tax=Cuniculiplasma sp. SKW3 TaxID=3400170 RepID=UPI003FCF5FA5
MKEVYKEDSAVSEIIGAILLFAIASVLLTSFILWYVPSTGTNNDIAYQSSTQQSFSSLDSKMQSSSFVPGKAISQSFPLGISGTPPFTPTQSTNLHYSSNFNGTMRYNATVNYFVTNTTKTRIVAAEANTSSSNILTNTKVSDEFTYSIIFREIGLRSGFFWTVELGGEELSAGSTGLTVPSIISFSEPRGTFEYHIFASNASYRPSPSYGSVVVNQSSIIVPISFSDFNVNGVVAAATGPIGNINDINETNFVGVVENPNVCDVTYPSYWLNYSNQLPTANGEGSGFYALASQEFYTPAPNTPVNYVQFYIEPNMVYYEQFSQGYAHIVVNIGSAPFQNKSNFPFLYYNLTGTDISNHVSGLVTLKFPGDGITLSTTGPYYLNFWEAVNENTSSSGNGGGELCYEGSAGSPHQGWGYGPNEFIGTITSPTQDIGTGAAYDFATTSKAEGVFNGGFFGNSYSYTEFFISHDAISSSYNPYYFLLGYTPHVAASNSTVIVNEVGLPTGTEWNATINGTQLSGTSSSIDFSLGNNSQYYYQIPAVGNYVGNISSGYITVDKNVEYLNITFSLPVGPVPSNWGTSDYALQYFNVTNEQYINYVTLYLLNFSIVPSNYVSGNIQNKINITILNATNSNVIVSIYDQQINSSGWHQFFFDEPKGLLFKPGAYEIKVQDYGGDRNEIGWGFTTSGGFDNYMKSQESNQLIIEKNVNKKSYLTAYYGGLGSQVSVSNQVFVFEIGYYNVTTAYHYYNYTINSTLEFKGSISSGGTTQFVISETYSLQDGIIITAGKGVTYVTVNPLPIEIVNTSPYVSISAKTFNMSMANNTATSVSGSGSTIVSLDETSQKSVQYILGRDYNFNNTVGQVRGIKLNKFLYTVNTKYAQYWADTFFTEIEGSNSHYNYTNFYYLNPNQGFHFYLSNNTEAVVLTSPINLGAMTFISSNISINSI